MNSLRDYVSEARRNRSAIGHFNISTLDGVFAVADAAANLKLPVIIGVSEGERDYTGVRQIAAIIKSLREEKNQPIFLNADHTYSFERVKEAIDAGFDAVIFDGAKLPMKENIEITKKCVEYGRKSGHDILMEGELGFIGTSSKVLDEIPPGAVVKEEQMTKVGDALLFVRGTGIDLLAPAVGNIHGVLRGGDPALNTNRVKELSEALDMPLVLHGASGNTSDDVIKCVRNGVTIVHVNTELRLAYRTGLVKSLSENPDEVAPYKFLKPAKLAMQKVIEEKLKILQNS
ncbi:MAG: class II fructose-bisphosphate aldolase [Candidatus Taylorbacteria bacterium]|nr:class II fructose-bisphosphate aldolase [Candidatus Taylorbacteria bacterium]